MYNVYAMDINNSEHRAYVLEEIIFFSHLSITYFKLCNTQEIGKLNSLYNQK